MSGFCPEGTGVCADAEAGPCVVGHPCALHPAEVPEQLVTGQQHQGQSAEKDVRIVAVPSEEAMFDFLSALNVSGLHPELACTLPSGGVSFLAGLTEPDADHVHITATESDTGIVHCCECSHPGVPANEWDPNVWEPIYPVLALVVQWPDMDRVAEEDYLDPWWTRLTPPTSGDQR